MWTRFIWLWVGSTGRISWAPQWILRFHRRRKVFSS
jgi:hypothetical protein